jgi:tubulin polyglutamylase TTLL6/13
MLQDIKPGDHMVCQVYLTDPFLIDGFKFDMRIYVLITSCDPLRIYIFDGLQVRSVLELGCIGPFMHF